jgi:hypothetical protein
MKYIVAFLVIITATLSHAASVSLPLGGKISVDLKDWNVQETKAVTGTNSLLFNHRKVKTLQGIVLDGTVKTKGECAPEKTMICDRVVPMGDKVSYQIVGQRYHGKDAYQNYVIAFTLSKSDEKKFLPILQKLKSKMELTK